MLPSVCEPPGISEVKILITVGNIFLEDSLETILFWLEKKMPAEKKKKKGDKDVAGHEIKWLH